MELHVGGRLVRSVVLLDGLLFSFEKQHGAMVGTYAPAPQQIAWEDLVSEWRQIPSAQIG